MTTASGRPATLHAYFAYCDAPLALRWLERVFGFEVTFEVPDDHGGIMHAELRRENVAIMVFSDDEGYDRSVLKGETVGHGLYVSVDDPAVVDAVYANAVAAGASAIWKPEMNDWGFYRCRVHDLEGYEWSVGTFRPGESQPDRSEG